MRALASSRNSAICQNLKGIGEFAIRFRREFDEQRFSAVK